MGIYGAGKAFNLRYTPKTVVSQQPRARQQMVPQRGIFGGGHCCGGNTNITVNNGPTGFWGFMSGMMGGLFGGGMMGNLFGGNSFGMNMGMGMSPYGALNNAQMQPQANQPQDKLAQLKTLYPNHNIVSDGNGKYSATDKDGNLIGQGLSYEDMCKALAKQPEPKKTDTNNDASGAGGAGGAGGASGAGKPKVQSHADRSPNGWYRAANDGSAGIKGLTVETMQEFEKGKIVENGKTRNKTGAEFVLGKILDTKMLDTISPQTKADLLKQIIRKNPSVFNPDGSVKDGADISKLDVPSVKWINSNYNKTANVGEKNSRADRGEQKLVTGNNGYYATKDKSGNIRYYNPQHMEITEGSFKDHCPTIHKNIKNSQNRR